MEIKGYVLGSPLLVGASSGCPSLPMYQAEVGHNGD